MGCFDKYFFFSDNQDVASGSPSAASTVVSTYVAYNSASAKDTWGVSKSLELGGDLEFTVMVSDEAMTGAGSSIRCDLTTKAANTISSGGTVVASVTLPATSALQTVRSIKLSKNDILAYTGVLYTIVGAQLTAGHVTAMLGPAPIGN